MSAKWSQVASSPSFTLNSDADGWPKFPLPSIFSFMCGIRSVCSSRLIVDVFVPLFLLPATVVGHHNRWSDRVVFVWPVVYMWSFTPLPMLACHALTAINPWWLHEAQTRPFRMDFFGFINCG